MFHYNNLCSLCLAQSKKLSYQSSINSSIEDMIERVIPEFVQQKSGIQRKMCDTCLGSLNAIFQFRSKCLKNITIFDEYVQKLQQVYKPHKYLSLTLTDLKLDIKTKEDNIHTNCLKIDDNRQENSNKESNEEQEENHQKSDVVLNIKKEIEEEVISDENTCSEEEDVCTNFLEINIKQENCYNGDSSSVTDEQKDGGNDQKSEVAPSDSSGSDTGKINGPGNQDSDCEESNKVVNYTEKYECDTCQKSFRYISLLKNHERTHTGHRPFSCDICGKKFAQLGSVKAHKRVHINELSYICNICQKAFSNTKDLQNHNLSHKDEAPFDCDVCPKLFKTVSALNKHKIIHSGVRRYECEICQHKFYQKNHLTSHMPIHTGQRAYQCHLCDRSFVRSDSLKRHVDTTHSNGKPNECNICKKRFKRIDNLRVHRLKHTM